MTLLFNPINMSSIAEILARAVEEANANLSEIIVGTWKVTTAEWHACLSTIPVAAKWSKPVSRLLGKPADGYNAIAYRDIVAISPVIDSVVDTKSNVATLYKTISAEHKHQFWRLLDLIAQSSAMAEGATPTRSPQTEEIRAEIIRGKVARARAPAPAPAPVPPPPDEEWIALPTTKTPAAAPSPKPPELKRQSAAEAPAAKTEFAEKAGALDLTKLNLPKDASVATAVRVVWSKLIDAIVPIVASTSTKGKSRPCPKSRLRTAMEKIEAKNITAAFLKFSSNELEEAAATNDIEPFIDLDWTDLFDSRVAKTFKSKLEEVSLDEARSAHVGELLGSILSFARVEESVPSDMLKKIETTTSGLLRQLKSGETTLDKLDLQALGESVLDKCSSEDTEALGNNLAQLLPVLQRGFGGANMPMNIPSMPAS